MFWYDGELHTGTTLSLPLQDPGLIYGATLFTTLRVYGLQLDHPLTLWQLHCQRLQRSLEAFGWQPPQLAATAAGS
ncbi:hypothetical protein [Neosynechococcus sphagnicola]|uniref:hypothetical protein n=1 Tax=Neosynechococcus sphagnicola TaxID=1501145 RepID=UPI001EF9E493|nr:hypothetical protein [Neosynechococcus sphagnicola]